jgi:hypothetical protein
VRESQTPIQSPPPPRRYTEEEQRLRWTLIIEAILRDPSIRAQPVLQVTLPQAQYVRTSV